MGVSWQRTTIFNPVRDRQRCEREGRTVGYYRALGRYPQRCRGALPPSAYADRRLNVLPTALVRAQPQGISHSPYQRLGAFRSSRVGSHQSKSHRERSNMAWYFIRWIYFSHCFRHQASWGCSVCQSRGSQYHIHFLQAAPSIPS